MMSGCLALADPYSAGVGLGAGGLGRLEQRIGLVAEPARPCGRRRDHDELPAFPHICGNDALGLLCGQRPGQYVCQLAHLAGAPDDIA